MYSIGKKSKITYVLGRSLRMLLILGGIVLCIEACSKDPEELKKDPPITNPPGDGSQGGGQDTIVTPSDSIEADVVSQYLKLVNAAKIPGQPPAGGDGEIWNDIKDSIFLMRGLPVGDRVRFLHDPAINVTGFYVYVPGASYYYDVPNVPEEGTDSTDVVNIDAEFSVVDFKDYPISFPLQIMPHDGGIPISIFEEPVKIEDPNDPDEADVCNNILRERAGGIEENRVWQWEFTIRQYNGDILNLWAPGISISPNVLLGGCCRDDGLSFLGGDLGCSKIDTIRGPRYTWVEFPANEGRTSLWEWLSIWDDGTIEVYGDFDEAKIVNYTRNFCTKTVDIVYNIYSIVNEGTHYFTLGTNGIRIEFPNMTKPNISFLKGGSYGLEYTCNSLIFTSGNGDGEEWGYVYKRLDDSYDTWDFNLDWYDNRNNHILTK